MYLFTFPALLHVSLEAQLELLAVTQMPNAVHPKVS
jgi:hypothetical protein